MNTSSRTDSDSMACLMIPIGESNLLIPNVTVAEILPWRRIKRWEGCPEWCMGLLGWRGETVPVVRFERFNEANSGAGKGRCLLIMNRTQKGSDREFYGLAVDGLPRLVRLSNDDLENLPGSLKAADAAHLQVGLESAVVPRLSYIEEQLASLPDY